MHFKILTFFISSFESIFINPFICIDYLIMVVNFWILFNLSVVAGTQVFAA